MHVLTKEDFNLYMKTACADKYINIRGLYIDENGLNKYPRILAIKMYLGYQKYYANDKRIFKVVTTETNC